MESNEREDCLAQLLIDAEHVADMPSALDTVRTVSGLSRERAIKRLARLDHTYAWSTAVLDTLGVE